MIRRRKCSEDDRSLHSSSVIAGFMIFTSIYFQVFVNVCQFNKSVAASMNKVILMLNLSDYRCLVLEHSEWNSSAVAYRNVKLLMCVVQQNNRDVYTITSKAKFLVCF